MGNIAAVEDLVIVLVDVQKYFLDQAVSPKQSLARLEQLVIVGDWLEIPILATAEEPLETKGGLEPSLAKHFSSPPRILPKQHYDLAAEPEIVEELRQMGRRQIALAGAETDVCVLQSALGLNRAGYDVYWLEDCCFSSASNTDAARRRMVQAGVTPVTYKSLFYELVRREDADFWANTDTLAKRGWRPPESLA